MSILNTSPDDVPGAQAALGVGKIVLVARGVNFNSANTDTLIAVALPNGYARYRVDSVRVSGASASLTTATCGVFTAAAGGGSAIVAGASALTVSAATENTNANMQQMVIANQNTQSWNAAILYFRVQTAQGTAATGNVSIVIEPLS